MNGLYMLDAEHRLIPTDDVVAWANWFEKADRNVAVDKVGNITVSTVFLGIDHRFVGDGQPIVFETMLFADGESAGDYQERCCTWDEAVAQHAKALALALVTGKSS